jgi:hypothetical protein
MNQNVVKIATSILDFIYSNNGAIKDEFVGLNALQIRFDFEPDLQQHALDILFDQKLIKHDLTYKVVSLTELGYKVQEIGYGKWLQEKKELEHFENRTIIENFKNLKTTRRTAIWALAISILTLGYSVFKSQIDPLLFQEKHKARVEKEIITPNQKSNFKSNKKDIDSVELVTPEHLIQNPEK